MDAEFTVTSASDVERLERTQEFVREGGNWRVVMRPEQVAAFTATQDEEEGYAEPDEPTVECRAFTQSEFVNATPEQKAFIRECDQEIIRSQQAKAKSNPQPKPKAPDPPTAPTATSGGAPPIAGGDCPGEAPIKGNASSGIYHVPGGDFYDRTNAEECFASESAAEDAGYRASEV